MDDFSWGNTRLVVGEGNNKKVIMAEDEKFDESMIPLKKFSGMSSFDITPSNYSRLVEYEAEAWETGSHPSDETRHTGYTMSKSRSRPNLPISRPESPRSYHQASNSGDYYRDTNVTWNNSSNPNLRLPNDGSMTNLSQHSGGHGSQRPSGASAPQLGALPFVPFGSGPGSHTGSDYGTGMGHAGFMNPLAPQANFMGTPSVYGMGGMGTMSMLGGMGAGGSGSQLGGVGPGPGMAPPMALGMQQRPLSTFSLATTMNPFAGGPNMNENPSDEELFSALRTYLSTQDLMSVTKKCVQFFISPIISRSNAYLFEFLAGLLVKRSWPSSRRPTSHLARNS